MLCFYFQVVVTALRIIEREERSDSECLQRQKSTGFLPQDRPKRWRDKALAVLRTNVQERIEGNQARAVDAQLIAACVKQIRIGCKVYHICWPRTARWRVMLKKIFKSTWYSCFQVLIMSS